MDEILKDVYTWSVFSEEKRLNFNGYFIPTQHPLFGNVESMIVSTYITHATHSQYVNG